mmetsp:Transcript_59003/g.104849  ORF Transcript_59003/g.104849 Transcript_59003/m.104849 type:complete len:226 (+) Transcript_59003:304-981(+)
MLTGRGNSCNNQPTMKRSMACNSICCTSSLKKGISISMNRTCSSISSCTLSSYGSTKKSCSSSSSSNSKMSSSFSSSGRGSSSSISMSSSSSNSKGGESSISSIMKKTRDNSACISSGTSSITKSTRDNSACISSGTSNIKKSTGGITLSISATSFIRVSISGSSNTSNNSSSTSSHLDRTTCSSKCRFCSSFLATISRLEIHRPMAMDKLGPKMMEVWLRRSAP